MWAKVDKDLSDAIADNINVRRSSEKQVDENRKSPALSSANTLTIRDSKSCSSNW